jgi:hypothetical protein
MVATQRGARQTGVTVRPWGSAWWLAAPAVAGVAVVSGVRVKLSHILYCNIHWWMIYSLYFKILAEEKYFETGRVVGKETSM